MLIKKKKFFFLSFPYISENQIIFKNSLVCKNWFDFISEKLRDYSYTHTYIYTYTYVF